ncbi:hypothetical protein Tco_0391532 [Tanacetum coccineum]
MEEKSGRAGIEVVVGMVVGAGDGVVSYGRGVIIDIVGGTVVACLVAVYGIAVSEATSSTDGGTFSKMRNLLAKSDETEELCFEFSVFCEEASVTCASLMTCSYGFS